MKPSPRGFVLVTAGVAGALLLVLGLLNYLVDPYNRFGNNRLGVYISAEREGKPALARQFPHTALLLGTSRMAMIPAGPLQGFRFFNAGFGGATVEEEYYFIEHFAINDRLVVLGADPFSGDPPQLHGDIFAPPALNATLQNVLNEKTVEYSVRTIYEHSAGHLPSLLPDGSFNPAGWFKLYDQPNPAYLAAQLGKLKQQYDVWGASGPRPLLFYAKTAQLLRQRGIACVVFVTPLHQEVADHLQTPAVLPAFTAWKTALRKIFPNLIDLSTKSYSAPENFFKSDPVHFKPEVGVQIINTEVIPTALAAARKNGN